MSWQMAGELRGILVWRSKVKSRFVILGRLRALQEGPVKECFAAILKVWFLYLPLRTIARWRRHKKADMGERGAQSEAERQQSRQNFCTAFLHAVDTDGDG